MDSQQFTRTFPPPDPSYQWVSLPVAFVATLLCTRLPFLYLILLAVAGILTYNGKDISESSRPDMSPSMNTLDDLAVANGEWEAVVREALFLLENEEQSSFHIPSSPSSPSSSVRVALHSTLQTTQTQCDNVRQLFSALTCPSELSQISEMYAPPSPMKPSFDVNRPVSYPGSRKRTSSLPGHPPTLPYAKRQTWNGSYSSLAQPRMKRREKHGSNLSVLFPEATLSKSAPVTPLHLGTSPLAGVNEDMDGEQSDESCEFSPFGTAALSLHRKRKSHGLETLRAISPGVLPSASFTSSSRFTTMQTTRHPLSLTSLQHCLQGALSSKRYACSHLLALRFSEEDDEGYWEDVRSVMELLTSTLVDASSRLVDALEEMERQKLRDQNPSPVPQNVHFDPGLDEGQGTKKKKVDLEVSFAPMPSQISRFAAHVAAINSSLEDAKEHLEQCVAALKEEALGGSSMERGGRVSRQSNEGEGEESRAIQAYERLRRELGLALRECERGREHLNQVVKGPQVDDDDEGDEDSDTDDLVPGLGHDMSDDSDKAYPPDDEGDNLAVSMFTAEMSVDEGGGGGGVDDMTDECLPLTGIEQVYEGEPECVGVYKREKSKMTREERIQAAQRRRESGEVRDKWVIGGEVVQELKDVIWKVGERRRKMIQ